MLGHLTPQERLERIAELLLRAISLDVRQFGGLDGEPDTNGAETHSRHSHGKSRRNDRDVA